MTLPVRTALTQIPEFVKSSYPLGARRERLVSVQKFPENLDCLPSDVVNAVIELHDAVEGAGGDFRITDARRSPDTQAKARKKYEHWLNSGKPSREDAEWDASNMKDAVVAKPGFSWHNAGRALDIDIKHLGFPLLPADQQLDKLWSIAKAIGWRPIIAKPDESAKEAWHFDYMGEWAPVFDRLGYNQAAMAACLDIGVACYGRDHARLVQAQLHRAGYDVGEIDGWPGARTNRGLEAAGHNPDVALADPSRLFTLPSQPHAVWVG